MKKTNGLFKLGDNIMPVVGMLISLIAGIGCLCDRQSVGMIIGGIGVLFFGFLLAFSVFSQYLEKYSLNYPSIIIKKGCRTIERIIPREYTVIVSGMSLRSLFDVSSSLIKGQCFVSIIDSKNLQQILYKLHDGYGTQYTSSFIEKQFQHEFFAGFVYDRTIPDVLFENAKALIIPRSVLSNVEHSVLILPNLVIDETY